MTSMHREMGIGGINDFFGVLGAADELVSARKRCTGKSPLQRRAILVPVWTFLSLVLRCGVEPHTTLRIFRFMKAKRQPCLRIFAFHFLDLDQMSSNLSLKKDAQGCVGR
jgi:hypothetical protein